MSEYSNFFKTVNKGETWEERRETMESLETLPLEKRRQALDKYYVDWLHNGQFDEDFMNNGYVGHINLAKELYMRFPDTSMRILDCASGNGFLGEQLKKHGFTNLDALDMSQGSLDYSRAKNVYTNFICAALGPDPLPIEDDTYDGICLTGGFGRGHVQTDCLPEWVRVTKPGGFIMFLVREETLMRVEGFFDGAVDAILHKMADQGCLEFLEKKRVFYIQQNVKAKLVEYAYMYVLKVL